MRVEAIRLRQKFRVRRCGRRQSRRNLPTHQCEDWRYGHGDGDKRKDKARDFGAYNARSGGKANTDKGEFATCRQKQTGFYGSAPRQAKGTAYRCENHSLDPDQTHNTGGEPERVLQNMLEIDI